MNSGAKLVNVIIPSAALGWLKVGDEAEQSTAIANIISSSPVHT